MSHICIAFFYMSGYDSDGVHWSRRMAVSTFYLGSRLSFVGTTWWSNEWAKFKEPLLIPVLCDVPSVHVVLMGKDDLSV